MATNKTPIKIELTSDEREILERVARSSAVPHRDVVRAQTIFGNPSAACGFFGARSATACAPASPPRVGAESTSVGRAVTLTSAARAS